VHAGNNCFGFADVEQLEYDIRENSDG